MNKVMKILLCLVGMPLCIILSIVNAIKIVKLAPGYSFWPFVGVIVMCLVGIVFLVLVLLNIKPNPKKSVGRQTAVLMFVPSVILLVLGIAFGTVVPGILKDATSGTLWYEDVVYDWEDQAKFNGDLMKEYIALNLLCGNYGDEVVFSGKVPEGYEFVEGTAYPVSYTKITSTNSYRSTVNKYNTVTAEEFQAAYDNLTDSEEVLYDVIYENYCIYYGGTKRTALALTEYVANLKYNALVKAGMNGSCVGIIEGAEKEIETMVMMDQNWNSIDKDGYTTFNDCCIDFANGTRMNVNVIVHLLLDDRDLRSNENVQYTYLYKGVDIGTQTWTVLDMDGNPMTVELTDILAGLSVTVGEALHDASDPEPAQPFDFSPFVSVVNSLVLESLNEALASEAALTAPLTLSLIAAANDDGDMEYTLYIIPNNASRGLLGYQNQTWLMSNNLLLAIISVYSTRNYMFIFAAINIIAMYLLGMLRKGEESSEDKNEAPCGEFGEVTL